MQPEVRRRWSRPVEGLWWVETVCSLILVPTPGIVAGLLLSLVFVPLLLSYWRRGRTLGAVGYWYSVIVVTVQAVAVLALPLTGFDHLREWLMWAVGAGLALWVGISAWFASEHGNGEPLAA